MISKIKFRSLACNAIKKIWNTAKTLSANVTVCILFKTRMKQLKIVDTRHLYLLSPSYASFAINESFLKSIQSTPL